MNKENSNKYNKRIIGITGGIGSGKTKVLELLKIHYNAYVLEADKIGHQLQEPGETAYMQIISCFGNNILETPEQEGLSPIDRAKLGNIVFNNKEQLDKLNNIMHPAIHEKIRDIINNTDNDIIVVEAAILTRTSLKELVDEIWYIYADLNIRLTRLEKYRNINKKKAISIIENQPDDTHFRKKCHFVIDNSYDTENTLKQIRAVLDNKQEDDYE